MKAKSIIPFTLGILVAVSIPVSYSLKTKHFEVNFKKGGLLDPEDSLSNGERIGKSPA